MDKVADLIRKLSIAAAAEGKSVTVIVCPTTVDIHEERDAIGGVAFSCIMAALRALWRLSVRLLFLVLEP